MRAEAAPRRRAALTWLMVLFAGPVPLLAVAVLGRQVVRTGNVSHWPWEEFGFFGWWLVPLSLWIAAGAAVVRGRPGDAVVRGRPGRARMPAAVLLAVAAITSLALLYNP